VVLRIEQEARKLKRDQQDFARRHYEATKQVLGKGAEFQEGNRRIAKRTESQARL